MLLAFPFFSPCSSSSFSKDPVYYLCFLILLSPEMPLEKDAVKQSSGVRILGIFQGYKRFSFHLPKLTALATEHVPLENHKRADCPVRRAIWTEACQGPVSVKEHCLSCLN